MNKIFNWIRQILLDLEVTITTITDNAVECVFYPLFTLVNVTEQIIVQWSTKPEEEQEQHQDNKYIGFRR